MPIYDYRCGACGAATECLLPAGEAGALVLVCVECGSDMTQTPSRVVLRVRGGEGRDRPAAAAARGCGHRYACRCTGVKLTRPNPFRSRIDAANGPAADE